MEKLKHVRLSGCDWLRVSPEFRWISRNSQTRFVLDSATDTRDIADSFHGTATSSICTQACADNGPSYSGKTWRLSWYFCIFLSFFSFFLFFLSFPSFFSFFLSSFFHTSPPAAPGKIKNGERNLYSFQYLRLEKPRWSTSLLSISLHT